MDEQAGLVCRVFQRDEDPLADHVIEFQMERALAYFPFAEARGGEDGFAVFEHGVFKLFESLANDCKTSITFAVGAGDCPIDLQKGQEYSLSFCQIQLARR